MDPKAFQNSPTGRAVHVTKGDYWAYGPNPLPPSLTWTSELVAALSAADQALGRLAGLGATLPNPHILIVPFMHREAVLSSQIEYAGLSLRPLRLRGCAAFPV
jgi:Fic family protein